MKRFLLFSLLVFVVSFGKCQSINDWSFTGKVGNGFIIAHRPAIVHVLQKHIRSFELDFTKETNRRKGWEELYNFPEIGIGYQYFNLGNPQELGSAHGLFGMIKFKVLNHKANYLKAHLGLGLGYITKCFNINTNYKNQIVGSHINATVTTGIEYQIRISSLSSITAGVNITHYSNGGTKMPNLGLNLAVINAGMVFHLTEPKNLIKDSIHFTRKRSFQFLMAGGIKQLYPPNSPINGAGVITSDYIWPARKKAIYATGLDFYFDGGQKEYLLKDSIYTNGIESFLRVGFHLGYGLQVGKCTGMIQTGYYSYNPKLINGRIYSTLSFRYHLNNHWFLCFNLKSHFARAEYFQYGFGYKI